MNLELQPVQSGGVEPRRLPALQWRDPHSVPPEKLRGYIVELERACAANPESADRALPWAERETLQALDLAGNHWELSMARKQLQTIRQQWRNGSQKPEWSGSLTRPTLALLALFLISSLVMLWNH